MTVKQFFKGTVFKCIITLLCVLLISGVFLTVMNGLLEVTDEERFQRALGKIYGKSVTTTAVAVANYNDNAIIEEAYLVKEDGNYLIKSTGKGGFENGTVTCWVVVEVKGGAVSGIANVVIDSSKSQSYISYINNKFLSGFTTNFNGKDYSPYEGFIKTGATYSATAICNAVNGAIDFVNAKFGNVKTEGEKFLEGIQKAYGTNVISVYGTNEKGEEKKITKEDTTVKGFAVNAKYGNATVNEYFVVKYKDGEKDVLHHLVSSTGNGGYENGTVTVRTAFAIENGKPTTIYKAEITGNEKQSFINDVKHMENYSGVDITDDGFAFVTVKPSDYVSTGATKSSTAINNAINGAITYIKTFNFETEEGGNGDE